MEETNIRICPIRKRVTAIAGVATTEDFGNEILDLRGLPWKFFCRVQELCTEQFQLSGTRSTLLCSYLKKASTGNIHHDCLVLYFAIASVWDYF